MTVDQAIDRLTGFKKYLTAGNPIWDTNECEEAFDLAIEYMRSDSKEWIMHQYGGSITCGHCGESFKKIPILGWDLRWQYCPICGGRNKWKLEF